MEQAPPHPSTPPPAPRPAAGTRSMETHVKVVGALNIAFGGLAALGALFMGAILSTGMMTLDAMEQYGSPGWLPGAFAGFFGVLVFIVAAVAVLGIVAGALLLQRRRSGKIFAFISAALALLSFPLGTAFGIYTFWALTRPDVDRILQ